MGVKTYLPTSQERIEALEKLVADLLEKVKEKEIKESPHTEVPSNVVRTPHIC